MPTLGSVEGWGCKMNDGQSMKDLMKVVDDWNEWSDDQGISTYTAWVLNPIFSANADFVGGDSIWFGYSPSFTEMGKTLQTWAIEGRKLNERFNEVWSCSSNSEYATLLVRPLSDGPSSAVVSFSDCTLNEGVISPDLTAAAARWNAYLDQSEVTAAI